MTFLKQLQSHRGGLIRLRTLYWYGGRGWDGVHDRVCLLLDSAAAAGAATATTGVTARSDAEAQAIALLLIDGRPQWIWVAHKDVELL